MIGVGLVAALLAAVPGLLDFRVIPRGTRARALAGRHLALNVIVFGLFVAGYAWRATDHLEHDKTPVSQLALSAGAVAVLLASVWIGSTLVYRHGLRVER